MTERLRVTEYVDVDLDAEVWHCNRCGHRIGPAREPYKEGCLVSARDPRAVHPALIDGEYNFAPDPEWVRIVEFYCPGCGAQVETEYLPPGHPVTVDVEIDLDALKARLAAGEIEVHDGRLRSRE